MAGPCDPARIVSHGYDRIAEAYLAHYGASRIRDLWLRELLARLPARGGAQVLDLGCGAGIPVARRLVQAGHRVVGLDGAARQLALARVHVPAGTFLRGDMASIAFTAGVFDAVAAFYAITHVPRGVHGALLRRIAGWLKPGGVLVASLGVGSTPDWRGSWLGVPMVFSHFDADTNLALVRGAGFAIDRQAIMAQDDEDARFLWVVARAPG